MNRFFGILLSVLLLLIAAKAWAADAYIHWADGTISVFRNLGNMQFGQEGTPNQATLISTDKKQIVVINLDKVKAIATGKPLDTQ